MKVTLFIKMIMVLEIMLIIRIQTSGRNFTCIYKHTLHIYQLIFVYIHNLIKILNTTKYGAI